MDKEDPSVKSKAERLKEGVTLLKKLREVGIDEKDAGSRDIQKAISEWVKTGESLDANIPFARYDRIAHIVLPRKAGKVATLLLKVIPQETDETEEMDS
jgi:hypothetical protein